MAFSINYFMHENTDRWGDTITKLKDKNTTENYDVVENKDRHERREKDMHCLMNIF
jgi:hypothetical protein